ncbi:MAG TPA: hypothetical protein VGK70_07475, partial [Thermoanaerobaculia bacterium]
VFAVMNNHFRGQAVANALQLQQMLTGEIRSVPESLAATYPTIGSITNVETKKPAQRNLF